MKKDKIWLEKVLKKEFSPILRFIFKHLFWFSIFGVLTLIFIYYNILQVRSDLVGGYFSSPFLTTLSEFTWFIMGGAIYLAIAMIKKLLKKNKSKRK